MRKNTPGTVSENSSFIGRAGDSYTPGRMTHRIHGRYVIGCGQNIEGTSFAYPEEAGFRGRKLIKSHRKVRPTQKVSVVR